MKILIVGFSLLALAGCASGAATVSSDAATATAGVSTAVTDATVALTVAEAAMYAYASTKNPSQSVIVEAAKLDSAAHAAINQYGPEATTAIGAVAALAEYLLTSAPGNGVTKTTVPSA
jgi:hypothetical protein